MKRFEPRKRTAIDGVIWWVVFDNALRKYSTLRCFGRYRRKKDCEADIRYYSGHPFWGKACDDEVLNPYRVL